jgi:hypothetical protein
MRRAAKPGGAASMRKQALLFVHKKKQKNFALLGHGHCRRHRTWPSVQKFFGSFFQKRTASFSSPIPTDIDRPGAGVAEW